MLPAETHAAPHGLMNQRQAAAYCGVAPTTIERWRKTEALPFVQVGSVVRYRPAALDEWIAARETAHTPAPVETVARRRRTNA